MLLEHHRKRLERIRARSKFKLSNTGPHLTPLTTTKPNTEPHIVNLHPGQMRAHKSAARFVIVTAGTQGGKTWYGPHWLLREIHHQGPGDYLIVTPTFALLERK